MLTSKEKSDVRKKLNRGYSDNLIADMLGVKRRDVFNYRQARQISAKEITERRLDVWIYLLYEGEDIELIAEKYRIQSYSIRQMLWRNRKFSFNDLKKSITDKFKKKQKSVLDDNW